MGYPYAQDPNNPQGQRDEATPQNADQKDQEAPEGAFSHYLTLADGNVVRYDVGDNPHGHAFPIEWNGVRVVSIQNAY